MSEDTCPIVSLVAESFAGGPPHFCLPGQHCCCRPKRNLDCSGWDGGTGSRAQWGFPKTVAPFPPNRKFPPQVEAIPDSPFWCDIPLHNSRLLYFRVY
jgi:hypothetical protein